MNQIFEWYSGFKDVPNQVKVATLVEIAENGYNLNIPLYIEKTVEDNLPTVEEALADLRNAWEECLEAEQKFKLILNRFK